MGEPAWGSVLHDACRELLTKLFQNLLPHSEKRGRTPECFVETFKGNLGQTASPMLPPQNRPHRNKDSGWRPRRLCTWLRPHSKLHPPVLQISSRKFLLPSSRHNTARGLPQGGDRRDEPGPPFNRDPTLLLWIFTKKSLQGVQSLFSFWLSFFPGRMMTSSHPPCPSPNLNGWLDTVTSGKPTPLWPPGRTGSLSS